jgi:tetratricopeptide (TPR) repeat protein
MTPTRCTPSLVLAASAPLLLALACATPKVEDDLPAAATIPVTTTSEAARAAFLTGRDLQEKLRNQDSLAPLQEAVAADPDFAIAHLFLAFAQPTGQGFFDELAKAVSLADRASEGERLWILGTQAGTQGDPARQRELYDQLVAAYPDDPRAHNLLGTNLFGQQLWTEAIAAYDRATSLDPDYSPPYNQKGYAHRSLGQLDLAEVAFKKYIELIPDDPNPYDSYAELLLRMGRYDESIETYREALSYDPNFVASHLGIATALAYKGEHDAALAQATELLGMARNDGEKRAALFSQTVTLADRGDLDAAVASMEEQYAIAEAGNDAPGMAGDLGAIGTIRLEQGQPDLALAAFQKGLELMQGADVSDEVKANAGRGFVFNDVRVAIAKGDHAAASEKTDRYLQEALGNGNRLQTLGAHQLAGENLLAQEQWETANTELQQANQQNAYNLYRMALAEQGLGDAEAAAALCRQAVDLNPTTSLNHALVRQRAAAMAAPPAS